MIRLSDNIVLSKRSQSDAVADVEVEGETQEISLYAIYSSLDQPPVFPSHADTALVKSSPLHPRETLCPSKPILMMGAGSTCDGDSLSVELGYEVERWCGLRGCGTCAAMGF